MFLSMCKKIITKLLTMKEKKKLQAFTDLTLSRNCLHTSLLFFISLLFWGISIIKRYIVVIYALCVVWVADLYAFDCEICQSDHCSS